MHLSMFVILMVCNLRVVLYPNEYSKLWKIKNLISLSLYTYPSNSTLIQRELMNILY